MQLSCTLRAVDQWDRSAAGQWAGSSCEQRLLSGGWRRWAWTAQGIDQWVSRKSDLKSYWPSTENESQGVQTQGLQFKPGFAFHIIEKPEVFQFHCLKNISLSACQISELQQISVLTRIQAERKRDERKQRYSPAQVQLQCRGCFLQVCSGEDIRTIENSHHVNINPEFKWVSPQYITLNIRPNHSGKCRTVMNILMTYRTQCCKEVSYAHWSFTWSVIQYK